MKAGRPDLSPTVVEAAEGKRRERESSKGFQVFSKISFFRSA
jgi:hypothetical protein